MNWDHQGETTLIIGMKGTGKTHQFLTQLYYSKARWKFVYDPNTECSRKLGWKAASTIEGLTWQFKNNKPVVFYSQQMFPGPWHKGFPFFTQFVWNLCTQLDGPKLLGCDENQACIDGSHRKAMPEGFESIIHRGRREEIDLVIGAQGITVVHPEIRRQATRAFIYKVPCSDKTAVEALGRFDLTPADIQALPHPKTHRKVGWFEVDTLTMQKQRFEKCI